VYETQMMFGLDLGPIPRMSHHVYENMPKSKNPKSKMLWWQAFQIRGIQPMFILSDHLDRGQRLPASSCMLLDLTYLMWFYSG
jgi:hypothetical protein